jgi:hypothetical membrane protein
MSPRMPGTATLIVGAVLIAAYGVLLLVGVVEEGDIGLGLILLVGYICALVGVVRLGQHWFSERWRNRS